jgi:hypothetical protein
MGIKNLRKKWRRMDERRGKHHNNHQISVPSHSNYVPLQFRGISSPTKPDGTRTVICQYPLRDPGESCDPGSYEVETRAPHVSDFIGKLDDVEYLTNTSSGGLTKDEAEMIVPQVKKISERAKRDSEHAYTLVRYREGHEVRQAYLEITARGTLRWPVLERIAFGVDPKSGTIYRNVYGKTDDPTKILDSKIAA